MALQALANRIGLITGIANKRSIAWAIAKGAALEGSTCVLTYQNARLEENVRELAAKTAFPLTMPCDVTNDAEMDALFVQIDKDYGVLDFVVHGVAFAEREDMERPFVETSREGFRRALEVSTYSLIALARRAVPLMEKAGGGSILTLSYLGSERVLPNYNVMGVAKAALESTVRYLAADLGPKNIRVNAISAGPIKTLAAAGVPGFTNFLQAYRERAPLRRTVDASEVADVALTFLSQSGRAVTGEVLYVDAGYHIMGV